MRSKISWTLFSLIFFSFSFFIISEIGKESSYFQNLFSSINKNSQLSAVGENYSGGFARDIGMLPVRATSVANNVCDRAGLSCAYPFSCYKFEGPDGGPLKSAPLPGTFVQYGSNEKVRFTFWEDSAFHEPYHPWTTVPNYTVANMAGNAAHHRLTWNPYYYYEQGERHVCAAPPKSGQSNPTGIPENYIYTNDAATTPVARYGFLKEQSHLCGNLPSGWGCYYTPSSDVVWEKVHRKDRVRLPTDFYWGNPPSGEVLAADQYRADRWREWFMSYKSRPLFYAAAPTAPAPPTGLLSASCEATIVPTVAREGEISNVRLVANTVRPELEGSTTYSWGVFGQRFSGSDKKVLFIHIPPGAQNRRVTANLSVTNVKEGKTVTKTSSCAVVVPKKVVLTCTASLYNRLDKTDSATGNFANVQWAAQIPAGVRNPQLIWGEDAVGTERVVYSYVPPGTMGTAQIKGSAIFPGGGLPQEFDNDNNTCSISVPTPTITAACQGVSEAPGKITWTATGHYDIQGVKGIPAHFNSEFLWADGSEENTNIIKYEFPPDYRMSAGPAQKENSVKLTLLPALFENSHNVTGEAECSAKVCPEVQFSKTNMSLTLFGGYEDIAGHRKRHPLGGGGGNRNPMQETFRFKTVGSKEKINSRFWRDFSWENEYVAYVFNKNLGSMPQSKIPETCGDFSLKNRCMAVSIGSEEPKIFPIWDIGPAEGLENKLEPTVLDISMGALRKLTGTTEYAPGIKDIRVNATLVECPDHLRI